MHLSFFLLCCCLCVTRPIYHVRMERDHPFSSCLNSHSFFSLFFSGSSPLVVLVILLSLEESMLQKLCCHVLCIIYYVDFKRERERLIPKFHAISFVHFLFCRVQLPIAGRLERNVVPVGSQHGAHQ